ncbi:MAG: hypothetical protein K0R05_2343 [Anaerocolumna sp.]|jgi:hypothetical protein|nr:hypothetical protein [Anaerocolumna sp.]
MKSKLHSFHQAALVIILIITYSSFSDCFNTANNSTDQTNLDINTNKIPNKNPFVFYYYLPSLPQDEDFGSLLQKITYRFMFVRQGNNLNIFHASLFDAAVLMMLMSSHTIKLRKLDKPRPYFMLTPRGHSPPFYNRIFSLSQICE